MRICSHRYIVLSTYRRRQRHATDEQEAELVSNASDKCPKENFIYRIIKFKTKVSKSKLMIKPPHNNISKKKILFYSLNFLYSKNDRNL